MIERKRIVIVTKEGKPKLAFLGAGSASSLEAEKVFNAEAAKPENEAVELFVYPAPSKIRFPARVAQTDKTKPKK